ncbi:hypothetical protein RCL1_005811 [Eukaryota sp. TZLM3-RCL]
MSWFNPFQQESAQASAISSPSPDQFSPHTSTNTRSRSTKRSLIPPAVPAVLLEDPIEDPTLDSSADELHSVSTSVAFQYNNLGPRFSPPPIQEEQAFISPSLRPTSSLAPTPKAATARATPKTVGPLVRSLHLLRRTQLELVRNNQAHFDQGFSQSSRPLDVIILGHVFQFGTVVLLAEIIGQDGNHVEIIVPKSSQALIEAVVSRSNLKLCILFPWIELTNLSCCKNSIVIMQGGYRILD